MSKMYISNHAFGVLGCNTAVGSSVGPAASVHAHWGFIHFMIVHNFTPQHGRSRLALAEERSWVAPEVATVGDGAAREGVAGAGRLWSIAETILGGGPEGVDSKEGGPLLNTAASWAGCWAAGKGWIGASAGGREAGSFHGGCAGCHG
jgi:hypothetical protein